MGQSTSTSFSLSLFKTIPPERVGLRGEYDHNGLAKRVSLALRQQFAPEEIHGIRVTQRGAVVVLLGKITSQRLLVRLINVSLAVSGAADVEINGVGIGHRLKTYLEVKPSKTLLLSLLGLIHAD